MDVEKFIEQFEPGLSEYCPVTIGETGSVYDSTKGHIQTLIEISGNPDVMSEIPAEDTPLFYLLRKLHCVIVDYENQVYYEPLSEEQERTLDILEEKELIKRNRKVLHDHN